MAENALTHLLVGAPRAGVKLLANESATLKCGGSDSPPEQLPSVAAAAAAGTAPATASTPVCSGSCWKGLLC